MRYSISKDTLRTAAEMVGTRIIKSSTTIEGDPGGIAPEHKFLGTGTFFSADDDVFVLTAMHVVHELVPVSNGHPCC
jgi:hypothetical protein